jgi:hypothetical protein
MIDQLLALAKRDTASPFVLFEDAACDFGCMADTAHARCIFAESLRYVATQSKFMSRGEYLPDVCALPVPLQLGGEDYAVVPAGPLNRIEPRLQQHGKLITTFPSNGP